MPTIHYIQPTLVMLNILKLKKTQSCNEPPKKDLTVHATKSYV